MTLTTTKPNDDYSLISVRQFHERINRLLDTKIGINKIYRLIKSPDFPSVKIGGVYYVIDSKVNAWLDSATRGNKRI